MFLRRTGLLALPIAALIAAAPLSAGFAQSYGPPPVMDDVTLTLTQEGWVETDTVRVVIRLDAAAEEADAAALRTSFMNVLSSLDGEAEWRFLSYDRRRDETGLERWTARAEARLPESSLDGLSGEAEEASRPGLAVSVEQTDFSPTLADREESLTELRREVYQRAGEEVAALNEAFPDREFRIAGIDFEGDFMRPVMAQQQFQAMRSAEMAAPAPAADAGSGVAVAERVEVTARIRLSSFAHDGSDDGSEDGAQ